MFDFDESLDLETEIIHHFFESIEITSSIKIYVGHDYGSTMSRMFSSLLEESPVYIEIGIV